MRFLKIGTLIFLAVWSGFSNAQTQKESSLVLLNYEQVLSLSTSVRAAYIRALRVALVDIEADQRKSASNEKQNHEVFALLSQMLLPNANASDVNDECIFAGWPSTFSAPANGHRYCHAPSESLSCGDSSQIKCNPAIFGDNLCVKRDTYATSTCDARGESSEDIAKKYLSDANLKKNWDPLAGTINAICAVTTRQQAPCRRIKKRLEAIEQRAKLPAPQAVQGAHPERTSVDHPKRAQKKNKSAGTNNSTGAAAEKEKPPCKKDRDKGGSSWGTCHAFCTLCTLDKLAAQHNFRTSANWVVFLNAVTRVCAPDPGKEVHSSEGLFKATTDSDGGDPGFDFRMALKYGFCDEENYLPYSDKEPPSMNSSGDRGLNANKPGSPEAFKNQFGISFDNLKELYCKNGNFSLDREDTGYKDRLEAMAPSLNSKFLKCAQQSLNVASKIKRADGNLCKTQAGPFDLSDTKTRENIIESAIDNGDPVSVEIDSPKGKHCVTVTDYSKQNQEYTIINSHGLASDFPLYSNDPIKFSGDTRGRKIVSYWYVDCHQSAQDPAPPAAASHQVK